MTAEIIKFPAEEYVLVCKECRSRSFEIMLHSNDPFDFKDIVCAECGLGKVIHEEKNKKEERRMSEKRLGIMVFVLLILLLLLFNGLVKAADMTLAWKASIDADGYTVHYGTDPSKLIYSINAGRVETLEVDNLACGTTYYFNVTAYNETGKSAPSNTVEGTTTVCPTLPTLPEGWQIDGLIISPTQ